MRLAVFASGGGSNFQAIIDATNGGVLDAKVSLCVSNKASSGALERARRHEIACAHLDPRDTPEDDYLTELFSTLERYEVTHIALAGYLRKIPVAVVDRFRWRMVNIHPSVLPAHGGPGMYGKRVHQAVIDAGDLFSGATVHFVDEGYDTGPSIMQDTVLVLPGDTAESLAARVLEIEHRLYPTALQLLANNQVTVSNGRVLIRHAFTQQ